MVREMSVLLYSRGYSWKPSSLQYMLCGFKCAPEVPIVVSFTVAGPPSDQSRKSTPPSADQSRKSAPPSAL
eukprot:5072595-Pyramimonas_sp.AAC.1